MTNAIRRFLQISADDKRLAIRVFWLLLWVHRRLRRGLFSELRAWAEVPLDHQANRARPTGIEPQVAEHLSWLVLGVANHHPVEMRCLERSLVQQRLLRERSIPAVLRIGIERQDSQLHAHAWLEIDGQPVCEPEAIEERFRPLVASSIATARATRKSSDREQEI